MRFAVAGAGITGLAAAFELPARDPAAEVIVLESCGRAGGKILTTRFAGRPVDAGADAFLARHPAGVALAGELGLADRLVSPAESAALVAVDGELRPLPPETLLGVPTDLEAVGRSGALSPAGLARAAADPGPVLADGDDAAIGPLVRRRLGDEVLDRLVAPLVGGINAGDPERLSVRATTPQLAAAAADPNLVDGARAVKATQAVGPVFFSLPGGMGELVDALVARVPEVRTDAPVVSVEPAGRGWRVITRGDELSVDGVVLAVPAPVAAELLRPLVPDAAALVAGIDYASVVLVTVAFPPGAMSRPLDASGFLVPPGGPGLLTACSFTSSKWAHLRAGDSIILRLSAGRAGDDRAGDLDDGELVARLLGELDRYIGLRGDPVEVRVTRWPRSFPQYAMGHLDRVAAVEAALATSTPGLTVAGAAYRGLGVPACIDQGRTAAGATLRSLAAARA
jgi:protoporphyrinogen/coproporphyrinogen III oxidase